jgi:flagellar protein FliL
MLTRTAAAFCLLCLMSVFSAPAGAATETAPEKPPPEFEYVEMRPIFIPVITEQGMTQQVSLVVAFEIPYGHAEDVTAMMPKLADAFLSDLYGTLGSGGAMMKGGIIDVQAVKLRLAEKTEKVLGPEKVNDVLLQVVQQTKH